MRAILAWEEAGAAQLLAAYPADRPTFLLIDHEAVSQAAHNLYTQGGFEIDLAEEIMRRDLHQPLRGESLPPGITYVEWTPELAQRFWEVYDDAFRNRPGFPGWPAQRWIDWISGYDDFRPDLAFLALEGGEAAGFIVCEVDAASELPAGRRAGWIVQVGVRPGWRGRGIGRALLCHAMQRFRSEGLDDAMLYVNVNNPRAIGVYTGLGFSVVKRRTRYVKALVRA